MASSNKHVVFDVLIRPGLLGTLVDYEAFYEAIEARLGDQLRAQHIGARLFGYAWMEAGEKEYTYLSMSGHHVAFSDVLRALFYRTLWQAGLADPRRFATDDDRDFLLAAYRALRVRPGVAACFRTLHDAGYTVWALTSGDVARVADSIGVGKPAPAVYEHVLKKFPTEDLDAWFAAGHMWDASAARRSGFNGAWVSLWEKESCSDIFGDMDVVADSLPELADGIVAFKK
ncbi:2-haloacid dehalogenase [Apiospora phragmitis]|uniref:2-haloacid dehalogenase n=1 Tax=Apiospora phragmitis TaxID=2905665 RepID=A0ABR1SVF5_9PEZI